MGKEKICLAILSPNEMPGAWRKRRSKPAQISTDEIPD
jgi:hypothetical protein